MKNAFFAFALLLAAAQAGADAIATTPRGIAVAHDGVLDLYDRDAKRRIWRAAGVEEAWRVVAGSDRVAAIDAITNRIAIADLATGRSTVVSASETPVDALFAGGDLFVLARDARQIERVTGVRASAATAADPAFLRLANGKLYVYARAAGMLQEFDATTLRKTREAAVPPFASDFEADARYAYLVYPREGRVRAFSLASLRPAGDVRTGAVPVDLEFLSRPSALTARTLAVADPSSKRVWLVEGAQSSVRAFARGFLRGLLGLGLFGGRQSRFPTGVDRVVAGDAVWLAYDSSSGTLYRFTKKESSAIAKGVSPQAFTVTPNGAVWWAGGTLVAQEKRR